MSDNNQNPQHYIDSAEDEPAQESMEGRTAAYRPERKPGWGRVTS